MESDAAALRFHRQVLGLLPGDGTVVDHVNRRTLDNRKINLRVCSQADNMQNVSAHRDNRYSGSRGVTHNKGTGYWAASHMHRGRRWARNFRTQAAAAAAAAARRAEVLAYMNCGQPDRAG